VVDLDQVREGRTGMKIVGTKTVFAYDAEDFDEKVIEACRTINDESGFWFVIGLETHVNSYSELIGVITIGEYEEGEESE
jgi:hypothetical protein